MSLNTLRGQRRSDSKAPTRFRSAALALVAAVVAGLVWSYWTVLGDTAGKWAQDPQYSHGYLVPAFAAYLLWLRRPLFCREKCSASWLGLPVLIFGVSLRLAGDFVYFEWLQTVSLLPVLAGVILLLGGRPALRWSWAAIAFLGFMFPLPYRVETAFSMPLQRLATQVSTYLLQTFGRPAFAEGNVIVVNDARIGVVEACNGLGMLLLFFAVSTAVAILCRRSLVEKSLIIASAAPVAVAANVLRIAVTSLVQESANGQAGAWIHDLAGWLMMPFAVGVLWAELWALSRLFVEQKESNGLGTSGGWADRPQRSVPTQMTAS